MCVENGSSLSVGEQLRRFRQLQVLRSVSGLRHHLLLFRRRHNLPIFYLVLDKQTRGARQRGRNDDGRLGKTPYSISLFLVDHVRHIVGLSLLLPLLPRDFEPHDTRKLPTARV